MMNWDDSPMAILMIDGRVTSPEAWLSSGMTFLRFANGNRETSSLKSHG
jgi:hypothetical protein